MSAQDRRDQREAIRNQLYAIRQSTEGSGMTADPLAAQWTLAHLAEEGVLAICNLAETIDARGAGIRDVMLRVEGFNPDDIEDGF